MKYESEWQINKPNGDIEFVTIEDLPDRLARKFLEKKYPDCEIELLTSIKTVQNEN